MTDPLQEQRPTLRKRRLRAFENVQRGLTDCLCTFASYSECDESFDNRQRLQWLKIHGIPGVMRQMEELQREF